jgi:large subunit ribosomal protein L25
MTAAPNLSSTLPLRLQNFFARYPPTLYSAKYTGITIPLTRKDAKEAAKLRSEEIKKQFPDGVPKDSRGWILTQPILVRRTADSNEDGQTVLAETEAPTTTETPTAASQSDSTRSDADGIPFTSREPPQPGDLPTTFPPNPFLPLFRNNHWRSPLISLRRQSDLVRLARAHNIEDLLPPGRKSTAFKEARLLEKGLRIKGVGEGQKVKGHKWERMQGVTVERRRRAMEQMPGLVREWRQKGHGRGWGKWPSSKGAKAVQI